MNVWIWNSAYVGYVIYHCPWATLWFFNLLNFVILSFTMLLKYSRFKPCDNSSYFNCYFFRTTYLVCHTILKCIRCIFQLIQPFEVLLVMMEVSKNIYCICWCTSEINKSQNGSSLRIFSLMHPPHALCCETP